MSIRIRILPQGLHMFENEKNIFLLLFKAVPAYLVLPSSSMDNILKLSGKKFSLAVHLVKMDPDLEKWC